MYVYSREHTLTAYSEQKHAISLAQRDVIFHVYAALPTVEGRYYYVGIVLFVSDPLCFGGSTVRCKKLFATYLQEVREGS